MEDGVSALQAITNLVENAEISVIISVEEFEIQSDGFTTIQNFANAIEGFVILIGI